ncbi:hypothetical protein F4604DRAFT_1686589, partial [Suillus subluteus]
MVFDKEDKSSYITHARNCTKEGSFTIGKEKITVQRNDQGLFLCYCSHPGCPKKGFATISGLKAHMKKAKSTWVGPEGKTAKSTREQSSSSHPSQNDAFDEERMMVSPILGPAMPFHDALDEDLQIPEDRASTSSSFSMSMSAAEVDSSSHLAAGNMQGHAADKRSPAYFAQEAEVESSSQPGAGDMQQDAADKCSPAYSAQEAEGDFKINPSRVPQDPQPDDKCRASPSLLRDLSSRHSASTAKTHVKVEHSQR